MSAQKTELPLLSKYRSRASTISSRQSLSVASRIFPIFSKDLSQRYSLRRSIYSQMEVYWLNKELSTSL